MSQQEKIPNCLCFFSSLAVEIKSLARASSWQRPVDMPILQLLVCNSAALTLPYFRADPHILGFLKYRKRVQILGSILKEWQMPTAHLMNKPSL